MIKNDLREKGFHADFKEPNESPINFIWMILTVGIIFISFFCVLETGKYISGSEISDTLMAINNFLFEIFGVFFTVIYLFGFLFLYLALKIIMTLFFCKDKIYSIHLKVLKGKGIPICTCKEALKIWQTVLIYLVPVVLMYMTMFGLCIISQENLIYMSTYMIILLFLSYYMAFDLTLLLYVMFYKIKDGADYMSVDLHIYQMTMFSKTCQSEEKITKIVNY